MTWMCECPSERPEASTTCGSCGAARPTRAKAEPQEIHIEYLKRCAALDPISAEDLAECKRQLAIAFARAGEKWQSVRTDGPETAT